MFWKLLLTTSLLTGLVNGYNLETRLPLYKQGVDGSTFGFSVALHKTRSQHKSTLENSLLVVGSPTAAALDSQPNTVNPGGIFYCPITTNHNDCSRVDMDKGESVKSDNKTGQWLGVSLKSQGEGKLILTCAHRHTVRTDTGQSETERLCGKCFLLNGTDRNELQELPHEDISDIFTASPCDSMHSDDTTEKSTFAYTQAGTSVSINDDEYLLGGPGAWSWAGAMFEFPFKLEKTDAILDYFGEDSSTTMVKTPGCSSVELAREVVKCENIPLRRDSYMGFSVTISRAMGSLRGGESIYIAGAPNGNQKGAVVLYTKKDIAGSSVLTPILQDVVYGEHIGSSFGFSVAVSDLNGDGLDDLIVGSPQYYQYSSEGKYGGAVYIYINKKFTRFSAIEPQKLVGPLDSFFGYTVTPLGDIDQDGYNDFAVSAPYDKPNGKIHIYRGSERGVIEESQMIDGADYTNLTGGMTGFGISLSSNMDIDNNRYPDLLVGTLQDQAILFRARPIITVNATLTTSTQLLDLRNPNCDYEGKVVSCFNLRYCFIYHSRHEEFTEEIRLRYSIVLDSERQESNLMSRIRFSSPQGESTITDVVIVPRAGEAYCPAGGHQIFFHGSSKDQLTAMKIEFEFSLEQDGDEVTPEEPGGPVFQMINDPILDADYQSLKIATVAIANGCGDDGCQSNLQISGSLPPEILVGGHEVVILKVDVSNDAEEAHQAKLSIKLPPRVIYEHFVVTESSGADISCFTTKRGASTFVDCALGNPYEGKSRDSLEIHLNVSALTADTKEIEVDVTAETSSVNPEIPLLPLKSKVLLHQELLLSSYGNPQQVRFHNVPVKGESAMRSTDEIGPQISFTYIIKNDGYKAATGVILNVNIPYEIKNGKWLLYPEHTKVHAGAERKAGNCSQDLVNPLDLSVSGQSAVARKKREATASEELPDQQPLLDGKTAEFIYHATLSCKSGTARCSNVKCYVDPIQPGATVSVHIQSRVWNYTILEEYIHHDLIYVITEANLTNVDSNVVMGDHATPQTIRTTVDHAFFDEDQGPVFPWWYILIGILAALLFYCIVVYLLIKCGFFKRKKFRQERDSDRGSLVKEDQSQIDEEKI
ncbi:unnamed protein product [Clavelina lepadiformis]|uniref:Integrin alpha-2 domain-containing protein n=1 Tax=Clavelina lepadiformis TaxID=159417 RepID=A0ABP0FDZ5_CLALP